MRSRAVSLPLAWTFSTAFSPTGCSVSSARLRRSASLPAVVWISGLVLGGRLGACGRKRSSWWLMVSAWVDRRENRPLSACRPARLIFRPLAAVELQCRHRHRGTLSEVPPMADDRRSPDRAWSAQRPTARQQRPSAPPTRNRRVPNRDAKVSQFGVVTRSGRLVGRRSERNVVAVRDVQDESPVSGIHRVW